MNGLEREREFYSVIRKNKTIWFEGKWTELENIVLSKISQVQKDKGCMFSLLCGIQIQNIKYTQNQT
jgi:hypothetical protein